MATVCLAGRSYQTVEENRKYVMKLLDLALSQKPDIVCLPEAFTKLDIKRPLDEIAEEASGPTTRIVSEKAREAGCYIICPIMTRRDGKFWNSAIIIDRSGEVLGIYDKVHPVTSSNDYTVFEDGVTPGTDFPVFKLDFGRIGIQICFDICFPEGWRELSEKGARIVFWPSAYNGGFPLQAYAWLNRYFVVSSVCSDKSRIIDPLGRVLAETDYYVNVITRDISLDYVIAHYDFNFDIPDRIIKAYPGGVEVRSYADDAFFIVEPIDRQLTAKRLQDEFRFESAEKYFERHRIAYERMRRGDKPQPQLAAHGDRPQYSKRDL